MFRWIFIVWNVSDIKTKIVFPFFRFVGAGRRPGIDAFLIFDVKYCTQDWAVLKIDYTKVWTKLVCTRWGNSCHRNQITFLFLCCLCLSSRLWYYCSKQTYKIPLSCGTNWTIAATLAAFLKQSNLTRESRRGGQPEHMPLFLLFSVGFKLNEVPTLLFWTRSVTSEFLLRI